MNISIQNEEDNYEKNKKVINDGSSSSFSKKLGL